MTATAPRPTAVTMSAATSGRRIDWPKLTFLGVLLIAFAVYTEMAMGMEWRTQAGRIGPGFFPRILGFTAMAVTVTAGVREIVRRRAEKAVSQAEAADEAAEPDLGRHPVALIGFVVAAALFVGLFGILGAVLAGVLFLGVTLWFLDPEHHIRSVVLAIAIPVLLYLAFQTGLNVGLPQGILPLG